MSDAVELASMIGKDLPRLLVFMDRVVKQPYHVLCSSFPEESGPCHVAAVIVQNGDKPFGAYDLQVALPQGVAMFPLPSDVASFDSGLLKRPIQV